MASIVLGRSPVSPPRSGNVKTVRGDGGERCRIVLSSDIDFNLVRNFKVVPHGQEGDHEGYNEACGCYCWGYRPPGVQIIGLGANYYASKFPVCLNPCPCPTKTVEVEADCPECPVPEPCPTPEPEEEKGKFGVMMGLLLAAAATGGVGYYGYKKGWFG